MTKILLDIGSGGTAFARKMRRYNHGLEFMFLCGEPRYPHKWNEKVLSRKIKKVQAQYGAFGVPDESIDFVTLNSFNALFPPFGLKEELVRTLRRGGVFFSAHPIGLHPKIDESLFVPISFSHSVDKIDSETVGFCCRGYWVSRWVVPLCLPNGISLEYPASPTILDRIMYLRIKEHFDLRGSSGYIYRNSNKEPSVKVWMKM